MKFRILLLFILTSLFGWGQYTGTGTFTKITSVAELTDGYYVITNETDAFVMTNGRSGNATGGYFVSAAITPVSGVITNPSTSNVWKIETNGTGRTIYNEAIAKYVGWNTGNGASIEDSPANTNRWTFTYSSSKWNVNNVATPARQLSYNSDSPRFAAYANDSQHELQFYKLEDVGCNPANVTTNPTNQSTTTAGTATFEIAGTGTVQWQENTGSVWTDLSNGGVYSGVTTTTLTITNPPVSMNGYEYRAVLFQDCDGSDDESDIVTLGVTPYVGPCYTENFSGIGNTSNYATRTWSGTGGTWEATNAREDQTINGKAITIRNGGIVTSPSFTGGIGTITFNAKFPFSESGTSMGDLIVKVNGNTVGTLTSSEMSGSTPIMKTISNVNIAGTVIITLTSSASSGTNNRYTIDDLNWTCYGSGDPTLTTSSTTLSGFSYIEGNGPSTHQSFILSGSNLDGTNVELITIVDDFEISTNDVNFGHSITLPNYNGDNTTIYVRLKAGLDAGNYTEDTILIAGGGVVLEDYVEIELSGEVIVPVPLINVRAVVGSNPSIPNGFIEPNGTNNTLFAQQTIGNSQTKEFFIENLGSATLMINSINIEGLNPEDFSVGNLLMNSNPVTLPTGIPAGGSLYFSVTFAPIEIGEKNAIISIDNESTNISPTYRFNIRGTGNNAEINVKGNGIDIPSGNTTISTDDFTFIGGANLNPLNPATASKVFVIENTGNVTLNVSAITITGADATDFSVSPTSMNITAGNTGTFTVTFDPDTEGAKNAVINIANNDATGNENPYTFAIRGKTISYIACLPNEMITYQTGFDSEEDFAINGTGNNITYQNEDIYYSGPVGQQWGTYYGTPSTTLPISGNQSMQMRWYTSALGNLGHTFTNFDLPNVTKVTFRAKNLNAINCIVSYSTDGGTTYVNPQTFALTTTATSHEYIVSTTGEYENVRLKFEMTFSSEPSSTSRLYIDNVVVYTTFENEKIWNGTAWSGDGSAPMPNQKAVFEGDYSGVSVEGCECEIRNNANVTITENNSFIIQSDITLTSGTLTVENNANLIQINDFAVNTGAINVERITRPMNKFSFTYWGSPVQTNSNAIQWHSESSPNVFDNIETVTTRYAWNPADNLNGGQMGWYAHSGATTAGDGYIIQAPSNFPEIQAERKPIKATFTGVPYNGNINRTVVPNGGTSNSPYENSKMTFLSNPYPSAIDIDKFLFEYGGFPVSDEDFVIPTIYLWTHATTPELSQNGGYNYASSDFATYSLLGGVTASPISPLPDGKIASGQGFFIMGSTTGGDVTFKNSYRYDENGGYDNNVFFKQMDSQSNSFEAHRFWLNLTGENATFKQTLIGYSNLANDGIDGLDGLYYDGGNTTNLYTILDELPFSIQAFALPFSDNDVIPLGYKVAETGTYTITLDDFDGLFDNQDIYIKDNLHETTHNLKDGVYEFLTNSGTFENRLEVVFKPNGDLNIQNPTNLENNWIVYVKNGQFHLEALGFEIKEIYVYDMLGREVYTKQNLNSNKHTFNKINGNQILIVKIVSAENVSSVKKIGN